METKFEGKIGERIAYIDELKGLAIILVVLGHIVDGEEAFRSLYQFIYSFHMPLFMFLAGCTTFISYQRSEMSNIKFIWKRFANIMIPYFAWAFLYPIIFCRPIEMIDWQNIICKVFITNRMFWFLPVLFGLSIMLVCYHQLSACLDRKRCDSKRNDNFVTFLHSVFACIIVATILTMLMFVTGYQLFRDMVGFFIPFFVAVFYMEYEWVRDLASQRYTVIAALLVYVLLIGKFDFDNISIETSLLRMILGMCFTVVLLQVFIKMSFHSVIKEQLAFLGKNTLLTYILHEQVLRITGVLNITVANKMVCLLWYIVISVLVCYLCNFLVWIIGCIPLVRIILLGKQRIVWKK